MYAADEFYDTASLEEAIAFIAPCEYRVDGEQIEGHWYFDLCGKPSVDDEGTPLCAEHLEMAA